MLRAQDLVEAKLYETEDEVVRDALRHLLRARPDLRIRLAMHRYETQTSRWREQLAWPASAGHR